MPTLPEESSGYGTDLPLSHMGHQICRIKSSQNVNFFLFEIRFLVHFCTHVAIDKDYFGI